VHRAQFVHYEQVAALTYSRRLKERGTATGQLNTDGSHSDDWSGAQKCPPGDNKIEKATDHPWQPDMMDLNE
jgi:hypothetical protein